MDYATPNTNAGRLGRTTIDHGRAVTSFGSAPLSCSAPDGDVKQSDQCCADGAADAWTAMTEFFQTGPRLDNQFASDALLRSYLDWHLPADMRMEIEPGLERLGERVVTDILALGDAAE